MAMTDFDPNKKVCMLDYEDGGVCCEYLDENGECPVDDLAHRLSRQIATLSAQLRVAEAARDEALGQLEKNQKAYKALEHLNKKNCDDAARILESDRAFAKWIFSLSPTEQDKTIAMLKRERDEARAELAKANDKTYASDEVVFMGLTAEQLLQAIIDSRELARLKEGKRE